MENAESMGYFNPEKSMSIAIWWIRRDLRLEDNPALELACQAGTVIPVFILDEHLMNKNAPRRQNFLFNGLISLDHDLQRLGSRLILRRGDPLEQLGRLVMEFGAEFIAAEENFSPYARRRDERILAALPLRLVPGVSLHHPGAVLKKDGTPYTVFTPFRNQWMTLPFSWRSIPVPRTVWLQPAATLTSDPYPESWKEDLYPAGEEEARRRLEVFIREKMEDYANNRDLMAIEGTSELSPYLRFGMLSPGRVFAAAFEAIKHAANSPANTSAETWLNELIWREFYISILFHFPHVLKGAFRPKMRNIKWNQPGSEFIAWQVGQTGYPIVDAGMRQLKQTGWMHNRTRMISASFLVKDLLINWQLGESWFMQNLVDGDPAANNGGWQWVAGTGTDAAPYFRIFNPIIQSQRFDPEGFYIRRWVPELKAVPIKYIHAPWEMPLSVQLQIGCRIGYDYPYPIVDHEKAKMRANQEFKKANGATIT